MWYGATRVMCVVRSRVGRVWYGTGSVCVVWSGECVCYGVGRVECGMKQGGCVWYGVGRVECG